jgi:hypothetical protein
MASFPEDRFDRIPDDLRRVGAHRAPRPRGRGWVGFLVAVLCTGVLVVGGLFALQRVAGFDLDLPFFAAPVEPTPTPTPDPTADPVLDPTTIDQAARGIKIDVLNGTAVSALQNTVGAELAALGWNIGSMLPSAEDDIDRTFVYYSDPANEDVARGLVVAMGAGDVRLTEPETFPGATLTIVLGMDYVEPVPSPSPSPEE